MKTKSPFLRNTLIAVSLIILSLLATNSSSATALQSGAISLENMYTGSVKLKWAVPGVYTDALTAPPLPEGETTLPELGSIDLGFLANCSGGSLDGYVDLSATLVFPELPTTAADGTKATRSPSISGTCSDNSLQILSERFTQTTEAGQNVERQFQLSGALDTAANAYTGQYRETLWGYGLQPFTIVGDFTLSLSTPATRGEQEYSLTVSSDRGTVTKDPDWATYHKGDAVQLTAMPEPGWSFEKWTGGLTGTANPGMVNIQGDTTVISVTAHYTQDEYTLTVNSDHGAVTKTPNQPTYRYGDVVTLSVTPEAGWAFAGWTPSLTDNQVTITGNTTVTANFTQDAYTLTVVSAHGTVAKSPDKTTYNYGDIVTLSATPDAGWTFTSWTPSLTGNQVMITGNTIVTANYNGIPTDISLSASSINENLPIGTTVGTLSTTDPDAGDTFTYSLACATPGLDDASFTVVNDALNTTAIFDYETKASYAICVRTTDAGGLFFDKNFTITVNNVIEPLSVTLRSIGTQDGWLLESGENTLKGGTMDPTSATLRLGDDAAKKQYRSLLSFATGAALPDNAVVTKVTLKVRRQGIVGGGNPVSLFKGFMVDIRRGIFGTSALQITDWQAPAHKSYGPFNTVATGGWYTIDLTAAKAYINKLDTYSGLTQFRLGFKVDDDNNAIANYLSLYSGNAPLAGQPALVIEYYIP
jgi:hypothetical protein